MAVENRTYSPRPQPASTEVQDYVADVGIIRSGAEPFIGATLQPSALSGEVNSVGQPLRTPVGPSYSLRVSDPSRLFQMEVRGILRLLVERSVSAGAHADTVEGRAAAFAELHPAAVGLVSAGKGLDWLITAGWEELHMQMLDWWDAKWGEYSAAAAQYETDLADYQAAQAAHEADPESAPVPVPPTAPLEPTLRELEAAFQVERIQGRHPFLAPGESWPETAGP